MAPPIEDLPFGFANSIHTATEEIRMIADSHKQWEMVRWAKSRGGVTLADLLGPTLVSWGGGSILGRHRVRIEGGEAWPVHTYEQERVAIRRVFDAQVFDGITTPVIFGVNALLGLAKFDVVPAKANGAVSYMAVDPAAEGMVPLWVAISDAEGLTEFNRVHDVSMRPFQWAYTPVWGVTPGYPLSGRQNHGHETRFYGGGSVTEEPDDWHGIPEHRIWVYAEPGDKIEVSVGAGIARDFDSNRLPPQGGGGQDRVAKAESAEVSVMVNGEFLDGGDLDRAGIALQGGFAKGISARQEYFTAATEYRGVLESRAYAVHNLCVAVRSTASPVEDQSRAVAVYRPQLRVRMWPKDPSVPS